MLDNVGDLSGERLTKLMFLMGIDENELESLPFADVEDVDQLCEILGQDEKLADVKVDVKVEMESEPENFVKMGRSEKRKRSESKIDGVPKKRVKKQEQQASDDDYLPSDESEPDSDPEEVKQSVTEARRYNEGRRSHGRIHPCDKCSQVFTTGKKMEQHRKSHTNHLTKSFCGVCNFRCETKEEWDSHETQFHLGHCSICNIAIEDLATMRKHHRQAHRAQVSIYLRYFIKAAQCAKSQHIELCSRFSSTHLLWHQLFA